MTQHDASEQRNEFCARLKRERERRGVSLADIAETTKVKSSLLDALERGDLSRWPKGIYRRSFFRDYAANAGLPVDDYTSEFLLLFADSDEVPNGAARVDRSTDRLSLATRSGAALESVASSLAANNPFRLTFGDTGGARSSGLAKAAALPANAPVRWLLALADVALVLLVSFAAAWLLGRDVWQVSAVLALLDLAFSTVLGQTPAARLYGRRAPASSPLPLSAAVPVENAASVAEGTARPAVPSRRFKISVPSINRLLRQPSLLREYLNRLSYSASMTARTQRRRELVSVRRRRVEAANASGVDEARII